MHSVHTYVEVAGVALLVFAVVCFIVVNWSVSRELWLAQQETSRFPLFAARHHLIMLIAQGKMSERDEAWQRAYARINFFLRMDQKLNILDLLVRYVRSQIEAERNPKWKTRIEHAKRLEKKAVSSVPEFGAALNETIRALLYLVDRRTNSFHRLVLWAVVKCGNVIAWIAPKQERKTTAKVIQRSVARPSSDSFMRWQIVEDDCFA